MEELGLETRVNTLETQMSVMNSALERIEKKEETFTELVTSVSVIAEQIRNITVKVDNIDTKVEDMKQVPARRWEMFIGEVIRIVGTLVLGVLTGLVASGSFPV